MYKPYNGMLSCSWMPPWGNTEGIWYLELFTFTQADVYEKCVEPLVKSCMEGYNATVFAYGQTVSLFIQIIMCKFIHFSLNQGIILATPFSNIYLLYISACGSQGIISPCPLFTFDWVTTLFWFYNTQYKTAPERGYNKLLCNYQNSWHHLTIYKILLNKHDL